jgi:tripartite-type tricarboxylate transporter receptor subunit TctC
MERGEINGRMQTVNSLLAGSEAAWMKEGKVKVLMQVAPEPHPALEGVPMIQDYAKDPDTLALAKFMIDPLLAGRPFAMPPEVPQDRVDAMRTAFDAAAADPDFLAEVAKANSEVSAITGSEVTAIIESLYAMPAPVLEKVKVLLAPQ